MIRHACLLASTHTRWLRVTGMALLVFFSFAVSAAQPDTQVLAMPVPGQSPTQAYDDILHRYVRDGQVDYPGIATDNHFPAYLQYLAQTDAAALTGREQQLAFWINAYNALAIKGILDGYSPSSALGKVRFFYLNKYSVGGRQINLYDLEHEILIPLKEARIHFAIICASRSCPKLRSEAYSADRLEQQLEEGARNFINDPQRNRFDRTQKTATLSRIFDWFEQDFSGQSGTVLRYIARYVADAELARALEAGHYKIKYLTYDWSLNGPSPKAPE